MYSYHFFYSCSAPPWWTQRARNCCSGWAPLNWRSQWKNLSISISIRYLKSCYRQSGYHVYAIGLIRSRYPSSLSYPDDGSTAKKRPVETGRPQKLEGYIVALLAIIINLPPRSGEIFCIRRSCYYWVRTYFHLLPSLPCIYYFSCFQYPFRHVSYRA